jgi:nucleotide-binding universal stress UspA family protein
MIVRGGQRPAATLPLTRIVVPLDGAPGAEEALPFASALADVLGLPVHVVSVVVSEPGRAGSGPLGRAHLRSWETAIGNASAYLSDIARSLRNRNLRATCEPRTGPLIGELLAAIRPGDVVVLASPERGRVERWWLGSVSKALITRADGPVVVVKPRAARPAERGGDVLSAEAKPAPSAAGVQMS